MLGTADVAAYRPAIVAGRYRVHAVVRETESHDVVLGRDRLEDRDVVLKRIKAPEREHQTRLRSVHRALFGLKHPSLMSVVDLVENRRDAWLISERSRGPSLLDYWNDLPLDAAASFDDLWSYTRAILVSLFDGLEALHRAELPHLDLKPTNVRVDPSGRAVLVDIGLGIGLDENAGEVGYLAPELIDGLYVSRLADQWSLGALIYRLVTGRPPIVGGTRAALEEAYEKGSVTSLREFRPDIPPAIEDVVLKMLAWEPDARFESIGAARSAFGERLGRAPTPPVACWAVDHVPLVGRDSLLDLFSRRLLRLRQGRGGVVILEDDIGRGKSRMLEAWAELAREQELIVHHRACLPGAPRAVLSQWFRCAPSPSPQERVAAALAALGAPAVLILDDLEDSEDSTWQILRALAEAVAHDRTPHPVLLVLAARVLPVKGGLDPDAPNSFRVLLPPLSTEDIKGVLRPGSEGTPSIDDIAEKLADESRGRPDRLTEALLRAERRGELVREGRRWLPRNPASEPLPAKSPAQLEGLFRLLAEAGRALPMDLVVQAVPMDRTGVVESLAFADDQRLVDYRYRAGRWWVQPTSAPANDDQPVSGAAEFHGRAATWLERQYVDDSFAEAIGHHHRLAGRLTEAAEAYRLGAKAQMAAGENAEARRLMQLAKVYLARAGR